MKTDLRIIKTKKAIREALFEILLTKDIHDITVCELASHATINRKTFYLHYSSVEDVLEEFHNELTTELLGDLQTSTFDDMYTISISLFKKFIELLRKNKPYYTFLAKAKNSTNLFHSFQTVLTEKCHSYFKSKPHLAGKWSEVVIQYTVPAILNVYRCYLISHNDIEAEEITRVVTVMTKGVFESLKDRDLI